MSDSDDLKRDASDGDELDLDLELDELELELEVVEDETPATPTAETSADPAPSSDAGGALAAAAVTAAVAEVSPADAGAAGAQAAAAGDGAGQATAGEGQWVWQFAAPPPPPSFLAVFFSGNALKELYRFFACGVIVLIGCLLPWAVDASASVSADGELGELLSQQTIYAPGYTVPIGAITLVLALWLVWAACSGIYSRRQKILPVFLMLIPAEVTWIRFLDAIETVNTSGTNLGLLDKVSAMLSTAGTGVVLALIGSTVVSLQLVLTIMRIMRKKDGGAAGARRAKGKDKPAKSKPTKAKADKSKAKAKKDDKKGAAKKDGKDGDDAKAGKGRRGRKR